MNISIYVAILVVLIYLLSYCCFKDNKYKKDLFFLDISFLTLFIVLFLRKPYSDLVDFLNIFDYFNGDITLINTTRFDFLYKLLNIVVGKIWLNQRFFIFIVDLITLSGPYFIIRKYSKNYFLSILFFISIGTYHIQFYVIRQAMALSLLLFSIKYLEERKFFKYLMLVICASLFHTSAIIFLPVYFLSYIKIDKKFVMFYTSIIILSLIFKDQLASLILNNSGYYSIYSGTRFDAGSEGQWKFIQYLLIAAFSLFFTKNNNKKDKDFNFNNSMLWILLINLYILLVSMGSIIIDRLSYYFCFPAFIYTINVTENINSKKLRIVIKMLFVILVFCYLYLVSPIHGYSLFF